MTPHGLSGALGFERHELELHALGFASLEDGKQWIDLMGERRYHHEIISGLLIEPVGDPHLDTLARVEDDAWSRCSRRDSFGPTAAIALNAATFAVSAAALG